MSRLQREKIDGMYRQQGAEGPPPSVEEMRTGFEALMSTMIVPSGIRTSTAELGGRPALFVEAEVESETPPGTRPGTILYFHGGSNVFGSPRTALSLTAQLVVKTGVRAFSVDYRLAPEHPFPAGVEDALSAYRALLDDGTDPSSVVFAGDSAGGGLAVTTCLAARDAGLPMPAAIVAFSSAFDMTRSGASMETRAGIDPIFTRAALDHVGAIYMAGQDPHQPLLSPVTHADLTGFPPMLLQAGGNEILLDDSTRMAARATEAGVDVVLDITADVPHVFQSFAGGPLDEADQALDRAALFISQHLGAPAKTGRSAA